MLLLGRVPTAFPKGTGPAFSVLSILAGSLVLIASWRDYDRKRREKVPVSALIWEGGCALVLIAFGMLQ